MVLEKWVYVDKTALVYELANDATHNFLSRPRRFGKSLLVSTLAAYFRGDKELFNGLAMEKLEAEWVKYPVFIFDFVNDTYTNDVSQVESFLNDRLSKLENVWGKVATEESLGQRFSGLIERAAVQTGKNVVILIDEYDRALTQTMDNPELNKQVRDLLKGFFSVLKGADRYIRFALLTGVTKFSKVSIFSDLNQLNDISLNKKYATICGITQMELEANFVPEIETLAEETGRSYGEALEKMKEEYNGYHFSAGAQSVYNPFSTINVLAKSKFGDYWYETGTPTFLVNELVQNKFDILDFEKGIAISAAAINDYRRESGNATPMLFQTGYLTIKGYRETSNSYVLGFPNGEVQRGFSESLLTSYARPVQNKSSYEYTRFSDDLYKGDLESFFNRLTSFFAALPYDLHNDTSNEKEYQYVFYVLMTLLGEFTFAEVRGNIGRADAIIKTDDTVYLFEFKVTSAGTVDEALAQIEAKGYAKPFETDPNEKRKIVKIGVVFDTATRNIKEWKTA
ncbi:ATPase AAA [Bacteroidia bacterium]|nr:ATPase AAA [Bacteroidia bacterium]GHT45757.1 ATPase AAA [Bacteroidia bacterium]